MEPEPSLPPFPDEVTIPVAYQSFFGVWNPELKGTGFMGLRSDRYRFTGRTRALLSKATAEVSFRAAEIENVIVIGRSVRFDLPKAVVLRKRKPFVFYCRSAEEAAAAARLLPARADPDFAAGMAYHARLRRLAGSGLTVTNVIIGINVAVFLVMAGFLGAGWFGAPDIRPYVLYGANNGAATTDGEWWRLLTSMFMHYGILHLAFNMWALFQSGQLVERLLGRGLFALNYLASGLGGGLLSLYWHGDRMWSAGASGAIFGVYGALLGHFVREHRAIPKSVFQPIMKSTLLFAGYSLFYGSVNAEIDNADHIGGFATGILIGWITAMSPEPALRAAQWPGKLAQAFAATLLIVTIGVAEAPRFAYSPREEQAWYAVSGEIGPGEAPLLEEENAALTRWERDRSNGAALGRLIDGQLIPFYQAYLGPTKALALTAGRQTDRKRRIVVRALTLKVAAQAHLSASVRGNNAKEFAAYVRDLEESRRLLGTIQAAP